LKMKSGNINQFIADFQFLAHWALANVDDPIVLHLFKTGLPLRLVKECVKLKRPRTFEQWVKAAQAQQCNWIVIQGLKAHHAVLNPPHLQLPPHDPDAMDTSAVTHKATIEAEKQKH
jgi:hypothetical protein